MEKKKYPFQFFILIIILIIPYIIYIFCSFAQTPIDSDYSNLVLEANDILNGNVFLKDWNLTGISFITTDLLYFVCGAFFFGISSRCYVFAISTMFLFLLIAGGMLLYDTATKKNWIGYLIYFSIVAFPCAYQRSIIRAHTGCIIFAYLGLYFINRGRASKANNKKNYIISFLFFTLATIGDLTSFIVIIFPIFLVMCVNFLRKLVKQGQYQVELKISGLCCFSVVLGLIIDKLYFLIGGANKNSFLSNRVFVPFENYLDKIYIYLNSIFGMFDAKYTSTKIVSISSLFYFVYSVIIIFGFVLVIYNIIKYLVGKQYDFISLVISIGFILISVIFIITDISIDINSARYFAYTPSAFAILLIRFLHKLDFEKYQRKIILLFKAGITVICCILIIRNVFPFPSFSIFNDPVKKEIIDILESNNLTNGYGDFWMASHLTVASENDIVVRAITSDKKEISIYNWFCKNSWYTQEANYIIVSKDNIFGISPENIKASVGNPIKIIEFLNYEIWIYDYNLSIYFTSKDFYRLGSEIKFATENRNVDKYIIKGLSGNEVNYSWTDGNELILEMEVDEIYCNESVHAFFDLERIYNDAQRVEVMINGKTVYSSMLCLQDDLEFDFQIPSDGKIQIKILLPDAISPLELRESVDSRTLALAIKTAVFYKSDSR